MPHAPPERGVFTAWHTTLDAVHLAGADAGPRFDWDIDFRFDADLFDLGVVRANVPAQVETIVGSELRDVDLNQNNYTADFTLFFRPPRGELGATLHHVSWHLEHGGRVVRRAVRAGPARLDAGVRALGTTERAGVDYTAQIEWYGALAAPLNQRLSIIGAAGRARDVRPWGAARLPDPAGAIDLYADWEQRIDAGQFTRDTTRWARAGIRVTVPCQNRGLTLSTHRNGMDASPQVTAGGS